MNFGGDILRLVGIALLPAAGMVCGALAAERWPLSRHAIGALLHAAAGVAVAVASVELMPRILQDIAPWQLVLGFLIGAACSLGLFRLTEAAVRRFELGAMGPWVVYLAVAIDMAGDGLMVGVGSAVASEVGLTLALSQVVGNVPGGFVMVANLRSAKIGRPIRLAAAASLMVPVFVGAGIGYFLLSDQAAAVQNFGLSVVVGLLLLATIEDLVPQADAPHTSRINTTAAFAGGFVFLVLLSQYVG